MHFFSKHKSLLSYFSFSIATSVLGFVAALVMMRLMSPEEFGRVALFLSVQFVAVPMISFAADSLIAINKAQLNQAEYEHFRCSYVTFAYLMFVVVQVAFFLLYTVNLLHDGLLLLIPLYGLIRFLIGIASTEYVIEEMAVQYGMLAFSTTLTSLVLTAIFLSILSGIADWRIVSLLMADILFLIVRYRGRMNLLWTISVDKKLFKRVVRFGFPLLLSVVPAWALNESDKIIVLKYVNMAALGHYAAACTIGVIMITFNTAMLNALTPKIYRAISGNPEDMLVIIKRYVSKFLATAATFGCLFAFMYWLMADWILPEKYVAARQIVYVVILFSLGRGLYSVLGLVTDYYGMTVVKLKGVIYGGITTIAAAILGVIEFGVIGAAIGVGSGYLVLSSVLWFYLVKKSRQNSTSSCKFQA
jgi:O-antigen/teichoic acid export membrane protein